MAPYISNSENKVIMEGLPTCANCQRHNDALAARLKASLTRYEGLAQNGQGHSPTP
ncbi:MAG: hypothetical protein WAM79_16510 [Candidatus Sulfotelmatobacter sp.]